jgi:hypothetical protein
VANDLFQIVDRPDPFWRVAVRRAFLTLTGALLLSALASAYRAWFQVHSLDLVAPDAVLRVGDSVRVQVVTSGRTYVRVRLELEQPGGATLLASQVVPKNRDGAMDPRYRRATMTFTFDRDLMQQLDGDGLLRATAVGRPQWMRTPPPTVKEQLIRFQP